MNFRENLISRQRCGDFRLIFVCLGFSGSRHIHTHARTVCYDPGRYIIYTYRGIRRRGVMYSSGGTMMDGDWMGRERSISKSVSGGVGW